MILIDAYPQHDWLLPAVEKRLREELAALQVEINEAKSRIVDLGRGGSFSFLGFATLVNVHEYGRTLALVAVGFNRIGKQFTFQPGPRVRACEESARHDPRWIAAGDAETRTPRSRSE